MKKMKKAELVSVWQTEQALIHSQSTVGYVGFPLKLEDQNSGILQHHDLCHRSTMNMDITLIRNTVRCSKLFHCFTVTSDSSVRQWFSKNQQPSYNSLQVFRIDWGLTALSAR